MDTREAIAFRIRQLCKERGITPNGLSNLAGVPQATVRPSMGLPWAQRAW